MKSQIDVVFNNLRKVKIAGLLPDHLPTAISELVRLAKTIPVSENDFRREDTYSTGMRSELISLAAPLWISNNTELGNIKMIGWPSYARQDQGRGVPVQGRFNSLSVRSSFDIRHSLHDDNWEENFNARKRVQVKSGFSGHDYAPNITVLTVNKVGEFQRPSDAKALLSDMTEPYGELYQPRQKRLTRFARRYLEVVSK